jgi:hypothetical protein
LKVCYRIFFRLCQKYNSVGLFFTEISLHMWLEAEKTARA